MTEPSKVVKLRLYWEFVHVGSSSFLTFYVIMAAVNYWQVVYDSTFSTIACTLANIGEIIGTVVTLKWLGGKPAYKVVIRAILLSIALLGVLPTFFFLPDLIRPWLTMIPLLGCGACCGILYTVQCGVGSQIGEHSVQALALGIGCSAVVMQFLQNIVSLCFRLDPKNPRYKYQLLYNVLVFHGLGAVCLLLVLLTWRRIGRCEPEAVGLKQAQTNSLLEQDTGMRLVSEAQEQHAVIATEDLLSSDAVAPRRDVSLKGVLKIIWPSFACQILTYFITYTIFPALYTAVPCYHTQQRTNPWFNLLILTIYFLGDFAGRLSPRIKCFTKFGLTATLILSLCRLAFPVLYAIMTLPRPNFSKQLVPIIHVDPITIVTAIAFSYSTGLTSTLLFMRFQAQLPTKPEKQLGAFLLSLSFQIGEFFAGGAGIVLALIIKKLDQQIDSQ